MPRRFCPDKRYVLFYGPERRHFPALHDDAAVRAVLDRPPGGRFPWRLRRSNQPPAQAAVAEGRGRRVLAREGTLAGEAAG